MNEKNTKSIGIFVLVSFIFGAVGGFAGAQILSLVKGDGARVNDSVYVEESQTIAAIDEISEAVVSILVYKDVPVVGDEGLFFDPLAFSELEYREVAGGSGFIVSEEGLIFTNKHVVKDETADFMVVMSNGEEFRAEVVSRDPFDDVAVMKIVAEEGEVLPEKFPTVKFGDSSALQIGQKVLAIGNALWQYENTVTSGIISAMGRDISAYDDFSPINFSGLLQTDASINFGNSGGPLVDLTGEVIGMNVAVAEDASGIGFAIPANDLMPILESVKTYGEIVRPVLGVRFVMLTEKQAQELDAALSQGALVIGNGNATEGGVVEGGAADEVGLLENDVILSVEGEELTIENPLQKVVRKFKPGDKVLLKYWRNGEIKEVQVVLKNSKDL